MKENIKRLLGLMEKKMILKEDTLWSEEEGRGYPIIDGIIDMIPSTGDGVSQLYDSAPSLKYDEMILGNRWYTRIFLKIVWGITRPAEYFEKVLAFLPDDFDGVILDVPAGTGALTVEKYKRMKKALIVALDYSYGMLNIARSRYKAAGIENVIFLRGDVGCLPFKRSSIDFILTMNGFHVFPEKTAALSEMKRVLKTGHEIAGCFYVKGKRRITDFVAMKIYTPLKAFTAPFYTSEDVSRILEKDYTFSETGNVSGIYYFNGTLRG